jgi:alkanesulfonate monooxygenase SsuD/methylene tetrahydromethanopterin reductase-like flavin-dependent oxidoreductase (luciferase family)
MDIGLCIFATDYAIRIDELARAAEDRGYESLFVPEHTHIPASRRTPFPGGGDLPREYSHTYDPFVSLMAAAAVRRSVSMGSASHMDSRSTATSCCRTTSRSTGAGSSST